MNRKFDFRRAPQANSWLASFGYVLIAFVACLQMVLSATWNLQLWYFWDELTWLKEIQRGPVGFFSGHGGNWLPLGKWLFAIGVEVARGNYAFFGFVSSVGILITAGLSWNVVTKIEDSALIRIFFLCLLLSWMSSVGMSLVLTWGFMFVWVLPLTFFAVTWTFMIRRNGSVFWLLIPTVLTVLTFSSLVLPLVLLSGAFLWWSAHRGRRDFPSVPKFLAVTGSGVVLSVVAVLVADAVMPLDPGARIPDPDFSLAFPRLLQAGLWLPIICLYWLMRPLSPLDFRLSADYYGLNLLPLDAPFILKVALVLVGVLLASLLVIAVAPTPLIRGENDCRSNRSLILALAALAAFVLQGMSRWVLSGVGTAGPVMRYDLLGVFLANIVLVLLISKFVYSQKAWRVAQGLVTLAAISAFVSVLALPSKYHAAIEGPRLANGPALHAAYTDCRNGTYERMDIKSVQESYQLELCQFFDWGNFRHATK